MRITYLKHSGFAVRTAGRQLLFDYIGGPFQRDAAVPTIALASHVHEDHYDPAIAGLADAWVLGEGIEPFPGARVMKPGDAIEVEGVAVRAFSSTDEGVSFYVSCDGLIIFHAGDLNFWHWREEGDADWTAAQLRDFTAALDAMADLPVDLAFFPVDARMGAGHDEGADMYLERIHPRVLVPMHWWGRAEVARDFARKHAGGTTRVIALTEAGESVDLF